MPGVEFTTNDIGSAKGTLGLSLISTLKPEPPWIT
ncbi:hypothetical protein A1S_3862 [Acinetobacter baumannii ATCC 17978]|nr:hypothetical protein A1S_3862 [Acinetobacter baumannii ATCC 17978]